MYFKGLNCRIGAKDPLSGGKPLQEIARLKRERGEFCIHPAVAPVSLVGAYFTCVDPQCKRIRRTEPCGPLHDGGPEPYGRWK